MKPLHTITVCIVPLVAWIACCIGSGFLVVNNDFWDQLSLAHRLSLNPQSWYNSFYPIGYIALLKPTTFAATSAATWATAISLVGGIVVIATVHRISGLFLPLPWSIGAVLLAGFYPLLFHYATTAGSDMAAVALFTSAAALLVPATRAAPPGDSPLRFFAAGLLLGLAATIRFHLLAAGAAIVVATALERLNRRDALRLVLCLVGFTCGMLPQLVAATAGGNPPLGDGHTFNTYKLMYGVNWPHTSSILLPQSSFALVTANPLRFLAAYAPALGKLLLPALPVALLFPLVRSVPERRFMRWVLLAYLIYALPVAAGDSARAPLPFLALLLIGLTSGAHAAHTRKIWPLRYAHLLLAVFIVLAVLADIRKCVCRATTSQAYRAAENFLAGHGIVEPTLVFSTAYDFYLPHHASGQPRTNGGFGRKDKSRRHLRPELPVQDTTTFLSACDKEGVEALVLNPYAARFSEALLSLYKNPGNRRQALFPACRDTLRVIVLESDTHDRSPTLGVCEHRQTPAQ